MTRRLYLTITVLLLSSLVLTTGGCHAFFGSVREVRPGETGPMDASYDFRHRKSMTAEVAASVLSHPFLKKHKDATIAVVLGIENRTRRHIDTKDISDTLTTKLLDSGRMLFVNAARRDKLLNEQRYQAKHARTETRVAIGQQLGAKYMITGSISDDPKQSGREVRLSKREEIYYLLTIDITDLETSLLVARIQAERIRKASKPLIGW